MPYWERSQSNNKKHDPNPPGPGGTANFIFKWTSSDENNCEHRYFPLMMTEGLTINFQGMVVTIVNTEQIIRISGTMLLIKIDHSIIR